MVQSTQNAKHEQEDETDSESSKNSMSAANKITKIVNELFLPLLQHGQIKSFTSFEKVKVHDTSLIDFVAAQDRSLVVSREHFLMHMGERYDHWRRLMLQEESGLAAGAQTVM